MTTIKIDNKEYQVNVEKAVKDGYLTEVRNYPLQPGDVYSGPKINKLLLVRVTFAYEESLYQLLGIGCGPNSNDFFQKTHTLGEIKEYLEEKKTVFVKNIEREVVRLVG